MLLSIADMLPAAHRLTRLDVHGYGPVCGPFVASEFFRVAARLNKTLTILDMSACALGDEGARAAAAALPHCALTALD
eukprot:6929944-Prymnesium_polylepis.1